MSEKEQARLDRQLDKLEEVLPDPPSKFLAWVRRPSHKLVRIPIAVLLILGGIFSILPMLGAWMLPLGLMLLAIDLPFLQAPVNRVILWGERTWLRFKRWRENRKAR
jgi:membrane-bound ClpP family serine protease